MVIRQHFGQLINAKRVRACERRHGSPFHSPLPLSKCAELVLSGVKFRLFRASVTVVIIALAAAFYADDDGRSVSIEHLIRATKREFQKMGKLCVKADFERYYDLMQND